MKVIKQYLTNIAKFIFIYIVYLLNYRRREDVVLFYPHIGMANNDGYNIINWKSDNALILLHYILDNNLIVDSTLAVVISYNDDLELLNEYVKSKYPNRKFKFIRSCIGKSSLNDRFTYYKYFVQSKYMFTSMAYRCRPFFLYDKVRIVDLGYFPCPFKYDVYTKEEAVRLGLEPSFDRSCLDYTICNSELAKRLLLPTFSIDYSNFICLGQCRNDYLISAEYPTHLRRMIESRVDYKVNKIILYTPTHRDGDTISGSVARKLTGYDLDLYEFSNFMRSEGLIFIAKLHPKQCMSLIESELPNNIMLYKYNYEYGLSELMKVSDSLITDYSSGYFDYLLMDKPVIFNFYDFEEYRINRGFTFEPIESICAGDIINDVESFYNALLNIDKNYERYKEMRLLIKNIVYAYNDTKSTERIFLHFFK